jgi:hypothetical protein
MGRLRRAALLALRGATQLEAHQLLPRDWGLAELRIFSSVSGLGRGFTGFRLMEGKSAAPNVVIVDGMPVGAIPHNSRIQSVTEHIAGMLTDRTPVTRMAIVGER